MSSTYIPSYYEVDFLIRGDIEEMLIYGLDYITLELYDKTLIITLEI